MTAKYYYSLKEGRPICMLNNFFGLFVWLLVYLHIHNYFIIIKQMPLVTPVVHSMQCSVPVNVLVATLIFLIKLHPAPMQAELELKLYQSFTTFKSRLVTTRQ